MFTVGVRDHVMIAHSFRGELFGPAQRLHGATYVVDVELRRAELDPSGVVVDIGRACETLRGILGKLSFRNLDELPEFAGQNTTTEFVARWVLEQMADAARRGALGPGSAELSSIKVTLHESHVAWASYERELSRSE
jgi:6-pyruvoyltetrahydropterin/6-carboxytetrahydropterin synthase